LGGAPSLSALMPTTTGPPEAIPIEATHVSVRRYLAHLLDTTIFVVLFVLCLLPLSLLPDGTASDVAFGVVGVLLFTVGQVAFYVVLHRRSGRTPGKALAGIRVVDADGGVPGTGALVKRSVPLVLEYFTLIALIGMLASDRRQRLGDRWGGTYVVRNPG